MYLYRISGVTFQSNVILNELAFDPDGLPEFTFQYQNDVHEFRRPSHWLNHWYLHDGSIWLSFAKIEVGYLLRFPAYADFIVSNDGHAIQCFLRKNCPQETMRHLLLNQVIPIVLSQLGKLVLHTSACATSHGVMAFMGTTGMGKSTLAASFGLQGYAVITDDCLLVEQQGDRVLSIPSYQGLRLWPESVSALFAEEPEVQSMAHYTEKKRVLFRQGQVDDPLWLRAVYVLTEPEEDQEMSSVTILPLSPREALFQIVKHTFQLDISDDEQLGKAFRRYEWLARSVPFFQLMYPRDHTLLPIVDTTILNHLAALPAWQAIPG
jgi:hypothetical protein